LAEIEAAAISDDDESDAALAHSEGAFLAQRTLHLVKHEFRETTWQAFQLTALEGLDAPQAAARLGITAVAVRKAKSRVLQRLRQALAGPDRNSPTDDYATQLPPTEGR
jgi:DNA-directed RNA polymerase specialized sigma24 family protein